MNRVLMLWPDIDEDIPTILSEFYSDIVEVKNLYKKCSILSRILRKILAVHHLSTYVFLDEWKKSINDYDIIIIHANIINQNIPKLLRKKGYYGRIIYWYWNPVRSSVNPELIDTEDCELWSFDKEDCENFNMNHNTTYYFKRIPIEKNINSVDAFFIGRDKNRYQKLISLKTYLENLGYVTKFLIIKDNTSCNDGDYSEGIAYKSVIGQIMHSNCVVEILQKGQKGMSLRVMEALFFNKKLISDNSSLINEEKYDMSNTFILGQDKDLDKFLNKCIEPIDQSLIDYYDFESWLNRIKE